MRRIVVAEGLRLDHLAARIYGTEKGGTVEALLTANPGLADDGFFVAEGRTLLVPDFEPADAAAPTVNAWD